MLRKILTFEKPLLLKFKDLRSNHAARTHFSWKGPEVLWGSSSPRPPRLPRVRISNFEAWRCSAAGTSGGGIEINGATIQPLAVPGLVQLHAQAQR
jgi:hypothetical protein